jgi:hypothetical protein
MIQPYDENLKLVVDKLDKLSFDVEKLSNDYFEIYHQANQNLINMAYALIVSATVALILSLIFKIIFTS